MRLFGFLFVFFFFILPAGLFLLFILKGARKVQSSEWEGEVIDKIYKTKEEEDKKDIIKGKKKISHFFTLVVRTNEGLTRKVAVSKEMYDSCQIGDKLIKPKGALNPRKA